jgi:hypothetical protein
MCAYKTRPEALTTGSDFFENKWFVAEPTPTSRNRLAYRNDEEGVYLFQANCLEIMDAMIAKHPHGRFDMTKYLGKMLCEGED